MAEGWNEREVDLCIDSYFAMLRLELEGNPFSKADFRRQLRQEIPRSDGSVEFKHQNISAVLNDIGSVFIDGYKPAKNVQGLLRSRVEERFAESSELRTLMLRAVEAPVPAGAIDAGSRSSVPEITPRDPRVSRERVGRFVDYQAREAANRALGLAGEEAVVALERATLRGAGQDRLAESVRHVSVDEGDGLGFDVLSYTPEGRERFIEVKTTRWSDRMPYLVSRNEVEFSAEESDSFVLIRLFGFGRSRGGFFELPGALERSSALTPINFSAVPRGA